MVILIEFGFFFTVMGAMGFRSAGLPLGDHKNVKGRSGRIIGGICLTVGIGLIGFGLVNLLIG